MVRFSCPQLLGYDQGFRKGAGIRLRPVEVNGAPFDASKRPSPALHIDDEHVIVTLGLVSNLRVYPADVADFGIAPSDRVVFELEEDTRSDEELDAADKE